MKKNLTMQERVDFVEEVYQNCVLEDEYQHALFDVVFRLVVLKYFEDVNISEIAPEELSVYAYELYDSYDFNHNKSAVREIESLREACIQKVSHRHQTDLTAVMYAKADPFEKFLDAVTEILESWKTDLNGVDLNGLIDAVKMSNERDPKELVNAMAAYAKSTVKK